MNEIRIIIEFLIDILGKEKFEILEEILIERRKQNEKWGGPEHDDQHGPRDWITFIVEHLGKATKTNFRYQMIRVAALAMAAIESHDRIIRAENNARDYESCS